MPRDLLGGFREGRLTSRQKALQKATSLRSETSWVRCKKPARQKLPFCRDFRWCSSGGVGADCRRLPAILGDPGTGESQCLKGSGAWRVGGVPASGEHRWRRRPPGGGGGSKNRPARQAG